MRGVWSSSRVWLAFAALTVAALPAAATTIHCRMDPKAESQLAFGVSGVISELLVEPGSTVSAGDPLARQRAEVERIRRDILLDQLASSADIDAQAKRVELLEKKVTRAQTLVDRDVGSGAELEDLQYEYELARIGLDQARSERGIRKKELALVDEQIDRKTLTAPLDGIVLAVFRERGEYAERSDPVVEFGVVDPLRVRAFPDVRLFGTLSVGAEVTVNPAPPFEGAYQATVTRIAPRIDPASGSFAIEAEVANPDGRLPAGHRCEITF